MLRKILQLFDIEFRDWIPGKTGRPPNSHNSVSYMWTLYKSGKRTFLEFFWLSLSRFIPASYPEGEHVYWKIVEEEGRENWKSKANLWRQVWHFLGGMLSMFLMNFSTLLVLVILKEIIDIFTHQKGDPSVKNLIDVLAWTSGALLLILWGTFFHYL